HRSFAEVPGRLADLGLGERGFLPEKCRGVLAQIAEEGGDGGPRNVEFGHRVHVVAALVQGAWGTVLSRLPPGPSSAPAVSGSDPDVSAESVAFTTLPTTRPARKRPPKKATGWLRATRLASS